MSQFDVDFVIFVLKIASMINRLLGKIIDGKLDSGKAIIVLGSRQTGKTSLLKSIFEGKDGVLFMNGDDVDIRNLLIGIAGDLI